MKQSPKNVKVLGAFCFYGKTVIFETHQNPHYSHMELLYIWIEKYKNIERQGFNFSPLYDFEFKITKEENGKIEGELIDHKKEEEREELRKVYTNFFGEGISNVTAIVGENGSGKSSLLEFIGIIFGNYTRKFIIIEKDKIITNINKLILNKKIKLLILNLLYENKVDKFKIFQKYIYYSPIINYNHVNYPVYQDMSSSFFIKDDIFSTQNENGRQTAQTSISQIEAYKRKEMYRKLVYLTANSNNLPFKKPSYVYISPLYNVIDEDRSMVYELRNISRIMEFHEIFTFQDLIDSILFYEALNELFKRFSLKEQKPNRDEFKNTLIKYLPKTIDRLRQKNEDLFSFFNSLPPMEIKGGWLMFNINDSIVHTLIRKFYDCNFQYLALDYKFDITFSIGEEVYLQMLHRLYYFQSELNAKVTDGCVFLIDEGELGLHPQWQKEYLKNLIDVLPRIFEGKTIQIILTSHSPFLVSDLPKENIIFLEKDKKTDLCKVSDLKNHTQTFGQNIHTLLADSFFLEKTGGLMGEFAKSRIQAVIAYLRGKPQTLIKDDDTAQAYINLIGEGILQRQLQKKLYEKKVSDKSKQEKIKILEQLLAEAKNDSY